MPSNLIPALDPAPLPGPPWLFQVLWVLTFLVHLLLVNTVLGGTLLAVLGDLAGVGRREVQRLVVGVNTWTIAFAITFAIAPLLFVQVVLGRFFYSSTILVAWAWLGMLGLLTAGYYLNYIAKARLRREKGAGLLLIAEAACFVAIAVVQVTVNLLHMQPGRWEQVAANASAALSDPAFLPRFLHFALGALSMGGVLVAFLAVRRAAKGGDTAAFSGMARFGLRAALVATLLQLVDGFWLLLALPEDVLKAFMRAGPIAMVPLTVGILGGVLVLVVLAGIGDPLAAPGKVRRAAELIVGTIVFMVITRHQLRGLYLAPSRAGEEVQVAPQWGPLALFLGVFVLCVALTVWALVRAAKDRPQPGEEAA